MPRRVGLLSAVSIAAFVGLFGTVAAQSPTIYNVFNMPAGYTSLQFVNVGDPGNVADTAVMNTTSEDVPAYQWGHGQQYGYGSVSNSFAMGTFDVTVAQYVQFLKRRGQGQRSLRFI